MFINIHKIRKQGLASVYQTLRQYTTVAKAAITDSAMNVILYVVSDPALNEHGVSFLGCVVAEWLRPWSQD